MKELEPRECHIICVNCSGRNSDFIELSKSCKSGDPCLDKITTIRVMIIKRPMRIFRQFIYIDYMTKPSSYKLEFSFSYQKLFFGEIPNILYYPWSVVLYAFYCLH